MNWCLQYNNVKVINLSRLSLLYIFELQILLLSVQLTCLSFLRANVEFHLRNYYDFSLHEHTFLESPKGTLSQSHEILYIVFLLRIPITTSFYQQWHNP